MEAHDSNDGAIREEPPPIGKLLDDGKPETNSVAARIAKTVMRLARPAARRPVLFGVGLGVLTLFVAAALIARNMHQSDVPRMIQDGNAAYQAGRPDEAIALWSQVIDHSRPGSTDWAVAVFNTGIAHREHRRYNEAIAAFTLLLESDANDEEHELNADGKFNLMAPFRNYHHRACLQIADCHEKLGDRASTVKYLVLARDKHRHESFGGTSMMQIREELNRRIKALEQPGPDAQ
jgi:tetratricopeptide (TPR) repeat protein